MQFTNKLNNRNNSRTSTKAMLAAAALVLCGSALADVSVPMNVLDEKGAATPAGKVVISESRYGIVFTPALSGLPPGAHGFHVHENASCDAREQDGKLVPALAAGGHYDPHKTKRHGAPWGDGHLGDLPALVVEADGAATMPVLAPRLKMADLKGRALMVHFGGDNYADAPKPLGGGGARLACGVIK